MSDKRIYGLLEKLPAIIECKGRSCQGVCGTHQYGLKILKLTDGGYVIAYTCSGNMDFKTAAGDSLEEALELMVKKLLHRERFYFIFNSGLLSSYVLVVWACSQEEALELMGKQFTTWSSSYNEKYYKKNEQLQQAGYIEIEVNKEIGDNNDNKYI